MPEKEKKHTPPPEPIDWEGIRTTRLSVDEARQEQGELWLAGATNPSMSGTLNSWVHKEHFEGQGKQSLRLRQENFRVREAFFTIHRTTT